MSLTPSWIADCLILGILGLVAGHTYYLLSTRRWMLLDPINTFWAGILVCYVGQPLSAGETLISWHTASIFNQTLLATLVGLIAIVAGYESKFGLHLARRLPALPAALDSHRLFAAAGVLLLAGVAGYLYIIKKSGGWSEWIAVGRGGTDYQTVHGYLPELAHCFPAALFLFFGRARICRVSSTEQILAWLGAAAMLWWFLYLGSRGRFIMAVILVMGAHYLPRRRSPGLFLTSVLFIATLLATNMQKSFRENFTNLSLNLEQIDPAEFWGSILPAPFGNPDLKRARVTPGIEFNCAMAVVELVPSQVPYNYGYGFVEILTRPIPRTIWPNKIHPHMESVQGVLREAQLSDSAVSSVPHKELLMGPAFAFVGHWYYVGGHPGLLIGGYITGLLLRFIRSFYDLSPASHSVVLIYPFLLSIGFSEAASTPGYWLFSLPFILLPLGGIIRFARKRPQADSRPRHHSRQMVAHAEKSPHVN